MKADVAAYIGQCHTCQKQQLQAEEIADPVQPRISALFEHVHLNLAGPFPGAAAGKLARQNKILRPLRLWAPRMCRWWWITSQR